MPYRPPSIIHRLNALQEEHGWLRHDDLVALAQELGVPLHRIEGVASFYPHYRRTPPPRHHIEVCRDLACAMAGGRGALQQIRDRAAAHAAATGESVEVVEVSCLGRCDQAPAALVGHAPVTGEAGVAAALAHPDHSLERPARRHLLDPHPGPAQHYAAARALAAGGPAAAERLLAELKEAGLRGMGGAGFPTAIKWRTVRDAPASDGDKFVVCNADESEPGTFKDREIKASLPHLVWEGVLVAALVVGARRGIIYIRHEYELERRALARALEQGAAAAGAELGVALEIFVSPGGYIMGEETALLEALEDRRGEPRNKPPFPGIAGLFGQPTLINNVETLAIAAAIAARSFAAPDLELAGATWWKSQGVRGCAGLKFVAISGDIAAPGVYEVPMGTTLRELIERAGGVPGGAGVQAVLPGGASTAFLPASALDTPLDFDHLRKAGSALGSGAVVVVAEGRDMLELGASLTRFFRNESCGKCVPCRVGSQKAVVLLERWLAGEAGAHVPDLLRELDRTLGQTSICGLGQVALTPALSVIDRFPAALAAHPLRPAAGDT